MKEYVQIYTYFLEAKNHEHETWDFLTKELASVLRKELAGGDRVRGSADSSTSARSAANEARIA